MPNIWVLLITSWFDKGLDRRDSRPLAILAWSVEVGLRGPELGVQGGLANIPPMTTYEVVTIYGVMSLDTSIFVIHITGDFQKMRGVVRSAILATVGLFSKQTPNSELFWPEEEVGGVWLWSSYPVPAWWVLGQSKVNLTGRTVEPLTLDLRITTFPFLAHVNLG